jgi:FtsP/CotA-like multicopper oxidase with cupredoxin domain
MRTRALRRTGAALALAVIVLGQTLAGSPASAATVTIDLCAKLGSVTLPGSADPVPVWGFALKPSATTACSDASVVAQVPGPLLDVAKDTDVTLNVTNALPGSRTMSLEVPGVSFAAGPVDVAAGATTTLSFHAGAPGTYLYQSAGQAGRQVAMGLYGPLIVRSATGGQAYDDPSTAYGVEATLVLSAIDPSFNASPDTFDMKDYLATYWLINGKAYPQTDPIAASVGQKVLIRYLNAGFDNTAMTLLGTHERVVARDANLLKAPFDAVSETIPAGATADAIVTVPSSVPPSTHGFPLYNRQLHLTNGTALIGSGPSAPPNPAHKPGGMLTFLQVG